MWKITTTVSLFVILFITNQSFSALFWYFQSKSYLDDYITSREANFHRGLFLSYTTEQKKLLCEDHFSAQLYVVPKSTNEDGWATALITDGQDTDGEPQFELIVSEISFTGDVNDVVKKDEIFIKCFGTKFQKRSPYTFGQYFISYGFQLGRWLASTGLKAHDQEHIVLGHNIGSSPQYVPMEKIKLEEQYITARDIMEQLKIESPAYVRLTEEKNYPLELPKWQRAVLCASLLSSPIYREERLEYSTNWILDHVDDLIYTEKPLLFTYNNHKGKRILMCDCILCNGFEDGSNKKSKSTDFCVTRSYDNQGSVYILKQAYYEEFYYLDKYFKNVAILTSVQELFKNYNEIND